MGRTRKSLRSFHSFGGLFEKLRHLFGKYTKSSVWDAGRGATVRNVEGKEKYLCRRRQLTSRNPFLLQTSKYFFCSGHHVLVP